MTDLQDEAMLKPACSVTPLGKRHMAGRAVNPLHVSPKGEVLGRVNRGERQFHAARAAEARRRPRLSSQVSIKLIFFT